jgi:alkaline phosphatase D
MGEGSGWARYHLSRRDSLRYSLATGAVAWSGSQVPRGYRRGGGRGTVRRGGLRSPNLKFFPQSVASGDPAPEGIVLWTRALPAPKDRNGSVRVGYRIVFDDERSVTDAFLSPLLSGVAQTNPSQTS